MEEFSTLITTWYRQSARDLPWRSVNDPYKIWLSEIILQQTRVDQGLAYYLKFTKHYPTVKELALASENQVLNDWQGLGYYSRARNLHATAKYIYQELNGVFPTEFDSVLSLRGVGEYTAAAICSFAYKLPHAVVDGNVYRVLSRYLNLNTPIDSTKGKKDFKEAAQNLLDKTDPAIHNQAIMELGALICAPKNPKCDSCPISAICMAREAGTQLELPVKEKKIKIRSRYFHYHVMLKEGKILLKKRGAKDIWQGLYDFPLIETAEKKSPDNSEMVELNIINQRLDGEFKHVLSHQHIYATFWLTEVSEFPVEAHFVQVDIDQLDQYPMPQLLIRYLESSSSFKAD